VPRPSRIFISTAGTGTLKIGTTTDMVHCSEFAYWPGQAEDTWTRMQNSFKAQGVINIIESTGEPDTLFEEIWWKAKRNPYHLHPIFSPWFHKSVAFKPLEPDKFPRGLFPVEPISETGDLMDIKEFEEEENDLYLRYKDDGMTWEALNWRRFILVAQNNSKLILFKKYFPTTEDEAFLSSVVPVYPITLIERQKKRIEQRRLPVQKMQVRANRSGLDRYTGRTIRMQGVEAAIKEEINCYHPPEPDATYVLTCDSSGGKKTSTYSVIDVWSMPHSRAKKIVQVAQWRGLLDEGRVADICMSMSNHYNRAAMVPEANRSTVLVVLKRIGGGHLFPRPVESQKIKPGEPRDFGWWTSPASKPFMVECGFECFITNLVEFNSLQTLKELGLYIDMGNWKWGPAQGFDDCVDSYNIMAATHGHRLAPAIQVEDDETERERFAREARLGRDDEQEIWEL
jgi:hypothetical protein